MVRNVITYTKKRFYPILSSIVCGSLFGFLSLMSCQPHEGSEEQLKADVDSFATYYLKRQPGFAPPNLRFGYAMPQATYTQQT